MMAVPLRAGPLSQVTTIEKHHHGPMCGGVELVDPDVRPCSSYTVWNMDEIRTEVLNMAQVLDLHQVTLN